MAAVTEISLGPSLSNRPVVATAGLLLLAGASYISLAVSSQKALLFLIGAALGLALYHAAFGFTAGWREMVSNRRGAGVRAQILMLAVASVLFLPFIDMGSVFGQPVIGAVAPVGVSVLVGATVFGLGMQLGGGCASGTLYTVGSGSVRMVITLVFFLIGSLLGSAHLPWWFDTPNLGSISLLDKLGVSGAIVAQLTVMAIIAQISMVVERRRHGRLEPTGFVLAENRSYFRYLTHGPWPLVWGAIALALLNVATLVVSGHPWTISFGFALWAAKIAGIAGLDVSSSEFWTWPYPARALAGSIFEEDTSVMNMGIIIGAALAAGLAGKFGTLKRIPLRSALAAAIGGLLMGYGARLAFGCNVGAFFSGIASGSLHGWLWLIAGFGGSFLGIKLRPYFGLS